MELENQLREIFTLQQCGVLSTHIKGQPYASLLGFAVTEDLKYLVFATAKTTRKYANLIAEKRAAFLVDNRSNESRDFRQAAAVTVMGDVRVLRKNQDSRFVRCYVEKLPHLRDFLFSPSSAFFGIQVQTYIWVQRFQEVTEIHLQS